MLADWSEAFNAIASGKAGKKKREWEELNVENMRMLAEMQAVEQWGINKGVVWHGSVKPA